MKKRPRLSFGLLLRAGRVLLVHRHPDRSIYPDVWDLPGGHIEPGEIPEDALRREVREELGVDVTRFVEVEFPDFFPAAETHVFTVDAWQGEPTNLALDEHDRLGWFTADELAGLTLADARMIGWLQGVLSDLD